MRVRAYGKVHKLPNSMSESDVKAYLKSINPNPEPTMQLDLLREMKATFERAIEEIAKLDLNVNVEAPEAPGMPEIKVPPVDMSSVAQVLKEGFEAQKVILSAIQPAQVNTKEIADAISRPVTFEGEVLERDYNRAIKKARFTVYGEPV